MQNFWRRAFFESRPVYLTFTYITAAMNSRMHFLDLLGIPAVMEPTSNIYEENGVSAEIIQLLIY